MAACIKEERIQQLNFFFQSLKENSSSVHIIISDLTGCVFQIYWCLLSYCY